MKIIKDTIKKIAGLDYKLMKKAQDRLDSLTKPQGSLGRLEELAKIIVGITGKENPYLKNKVIFTLASDHGVTEEKISAYPKEVTAQMVYNFLRDGAGINVLARHIGARVVVVDMGVAVKIQSSKIPATKIGGSAKHFGGKNQNFKDKKINYGTKNMAKGPAMTRAEAIRSIEAGIEIFEEEFSAKGGSLAIRQAGASGGKKGIDIVGTGDMGIGNTTASSAITAVLTKSSVEEVTGRGTGIDDKTLKNKIRIIKGALRINNPDPNDPLDILSKVGGFEIGGLAGIILAAASKRIPIVIDGFISGAAALIAYNLEPMVKDYIIASHCSAERGHRIILNHIGLRPILDLDLRLGEGTGAALGISIIEAAVKVLTQMATFKSAGVSEKTKK